MQDDRGRVIAATQANLFACIDGAWATPRLDECGVAGVMRRAFRAWCEGQGTPVEERRLEVADVASATSLVLTNALIGAWPVAMLDGRSLDIAPAVPAFNAWLARP
jgi:4-amino-4-deoxychorismate lyase